MNPDIQPIEIVRLGVVAPGWVISAWLSLSCLRTPSDLPYARGTLRHMVVHLYVVLQALLFVTQCLFLAYSLVVLYIPPDTASRPSGPLQWVVSGMSILVPVCLTTTTVIVAWARHHARFLS